MAQTALLLTLARVLIAFSSAQEVDVSYIVPLDYNPEIRPGNPLESNALNISISVFVNDLVDAANKDQAIELDIILVQEWTDNRLNVSEIERNQNFIVTDPSIIKKFWVPETYIVNGISANVVNAFQSTEKLTITFDGLMSYAQRIDALLSCRMNLQNFPHDIQYCRIKISNLIYNQSEIRLVWNRFEAQTGNYPIFKVRYWYTGECEGLENPMPENSCISGTLKLVRRLSYYVIRYYLLTFLCVAISIVNFWLPINGWPARVTLLVMPLLNLISQDISIQNDVGVYYVYSFHWWMMWLQGIIYLEIVEYGVAIAWAHFVSDKKYWAKCVEQANTNGTPLPVPPSGITGYYFGNKSLYSKFGAFFDKFLYFCFGNVDFKLDPYTRNKVDYMSRVVFSAFLISFTFLYVCICVFYWAGNYNEE